MKTSGRLLSSLFLLCCLAFAQPTVHQVSLSWLTSGTITGNCVYRGTASGGPYTQLACSPTPSTSYVDSTVVGGQTYYYVVTSVDGQEESAYSNQVQAVVPQSPNAPTGLTAVVQ